MVAVVRQGQASLSQIAKDSPLVTELADAGIHVTVTCRVLELSRQPCHRWLADITEHETTEGKLYCSDIKDPCSGRIVGYSIDSRMKSRLAVQAQENAIAMRGGATRT